jgi:glycosyltransferase involved in cell wall biosynthesis
LTVFDVTTLKLPYLHSRFAVWFWRYIQAVFIWSADRIITISHDVKQDMVTYFKIPLNKIDVVYCAPKSVFYPCVCDSEELNILRERYNLPKNYMLFVGILAKKKNLPTLIDAMYYLKEAEKRYLPLVIIGRRYRQSDDAAIFDQISALGLEDDVVYLGPIPDEDLPGLYYGAEIFIFPSLHEGFGIPCLEAMACQVPVIASQSGAIPEVVDDAALLITEPENPRSFADAILRLLNDHNLRKELVEKGFKRAELFNWSRLAEQVLNIYEQTLGES